MRKFFLFVLAGFVVFCSSSSGGGGGYVIGFDAFDFTELNNFLNARGFGSVDKYIFSEGGLGYARIGKIMVGGSGYGFSDDISSNDYLCKITVGYGGFEAGYTLFSIGDLSISGILGFGGGSITLRVDENFNAPVFDSVFSNPGRTSIIYSDYTVIKAELGIDYLLAFGKTGGSGGGLLFGIRGGYIYSPSKPDWKFTDINTDIIGGPNVILKGPYIHFLVIGGGGFGGD